MARNIRIPHGIIIGSFVLALAVGGFITHAAPARAFPVEIVADAQKTVQQVSGGAFAGAYMSALQYFINKVAYDAAVWIASGGKGQKPLMFDDPGAYFKNTALDAAGEALANLNNLDFLKKAGINLCMPPDVNLRLRIKMDIAGIYVNPPTPKCRWSDIKNAYEQIGTPGYWRNIGLAFEPGNNDISLYMAANTAVKEYSLNKEREARDDTAGLARGDTIAPVDPTTGKPTAPRVIVESVVEAQSPTKIAEGTTADARALTPSILEGTWGALILGANTFVNTLSSQLMQKLTTRGFFSGINSVCYLTDNQQSFCPQNAGSATAQGSFGGKTAASLAFADLLTPKIYTVNDYDGTLIAELGSCDASHRGLYNCTADGSLLAALQQAKSGSTLTVAEAIDKGFLHKDWQVIPPSKVADNQDPNCFTRAYCYSNLVKLRQLNILPVGFEMAALQSDFKQPYTLDFFVKNFNNEKTIAYHLIDPNWLIKLPPTTCKARVFGPFLAMEGAANRSEYCADIATCVNEDENGGCSSGQYGYCRQTKNIWRLGGDSCPAQYNTCTAVISRAGDAAAYLANTINKGVCSEKNIGCRAYNTVQEYNSEGVWQWKGTGLQAADANALYFTKDALSCSMQEEGCSQFVRQIESVRGQDLFLRKAPDYYNCYSGNGVTFSSSTLSWPANRADLVKLETSLTDAQKTQCNRFARVCSVEENRCESYTPANGDPQVSGILSVDDLCPMECVGYDSFIQQSSFFEPVANIAPQYFIPSTAQACTADSAGCDEFTDIENGAGEQKSYFTELHLCGKDPQEGATYYTWEGSDTTGYQLKSYVLKKSKAQGEVGGYIIDENNGEQPAYVDANKTGKLTEYATICNKKAYADRLTNPKFDSDCREFYDKDGHISYRLWSKTITIDPSACKKFRKAVAYGGKQTCEDTNGTWDAQTNSCVYLGIVSESNACQAEAVGCRAYKGNGGNNYQILEQANFESGALPPWQGGVISTESTVQGGHSVKIIKQGSEKVFQRIFDSASAPKNTTFLVNFWAKGTANKSVKALLYQGAPTSGQQAVAENTFAVSNNWQVYTAGPFTVDAKWDGSSVIAFKPNDQSADIFIDNITIRKMQDMVYAVRNSWETPASCDNPITDPAGSSGGGTADAPLRTVPQAMLGCAAYTTRQGQIVNAKSFTNICRAEAVGCEEVKDTHNTSSADATYVNLLCQLTDYSDDTPPAGNSYHANGVSTPKKPFNNTNVEVACTDANSVTLCQIQPGQSGCRLTISSDVKFTPNTPQNGGTSDPVNPADVNKNNKINFELIQDGQTQIIAKDSIVYLVNDPAYSCAADALGCSALGARAWNANSTLSQNSGIIASYSTTYIKDTPDEYGKLLCQPEAEGCDAYTTGKGGQMYFKDPQVWGDMVCEWRDNVEYAGAVYDGWFRKGDVGFCAALNDTNPAGKINLKQCVSDSDCDKSKTEICNKPLPCYPGYVIDGTTFGIYRAGDAGYNKTTNPVGACPAQMDSCSEFLDPADTSSLKPKGAPYYMLDNGKLDRASCGGLVSKEQGCILFDKTSDVGNNPWVVQDTYNASKAKGYALVQPVAVAQKDTSGDANTILKVKRDRVCSEWLTCASSQDVFDPNTAKTITQCLALQSCVKPSSIGKNNVGTIGNCGQYGSEFKNAADALSNNIVASAEKYQTRAIGFQEPDYTGYSIPFSYPIEFYKTVQTQTSNTSNTSLAFVYCPASGGVNCETSISVNYDSTFCKEVGKVCGKNDDPKGKCDQHYRCAISDPPNKTLAPSAYKIAPLSCRGYPAADAPYTFGKNLPQAQNNANPLDIRPLKYKDANTCVTGQNCECSYNTALYGDPNKGEQTKKAFFEPGQNAPEKVCSGGDDDGAAVTVLGNGTNSPTCKGGKVLDKFKFENEYIGWQDYCLEYDTSQVLYYKNGQPVHPCLTWYPVDKAPGAADIYAQQTSAGYKLGANVYYCAAGDHLFKNAAVEEMCGGHNDDSTCGTTDWSLCLKNVTCEEGKIAIVGTCDTGGSCDKGALTLDQCPFKCIPIDSVFEGMVKGKSEAQNLSNSDIINSVIANDVPGGESNNDKELAQTVGPYKSCYEFIEEYVKAKKFSDEVVKNQQNIITKISLGKEHNAEPSKNSNPEGDHTYVEKFLQNCVTHGSIHKAIKESTDEFACTALAQVSETQSAGQSKPWTNRLQNKEPGFALDSSNSKFAYKYSTLQEPFGEALFPKINAYPSIFPVCKDAQGNFVLPYPLSGNCVEGTSFQDGGSPVQSRPYQFQANPQETILKEDIKEGISRLQKIFAKVLKVWKWKPPLTEEMKGNWSVSQTASNIDLRLGKYKIESWIDLFGTQDNAFNLGKQADHFPPRLHPVDGTKEGAEADTVGQGFSINGAYGKSGESSYFVQSAPFAATLSFYGFADKNHMPLRRIAVDWGDGSSIIGEDAGAVNFYKNRRGKLISSGDTKASGCNTEKEGWGGDPNACDDQTGPFTYQHTYLYKDPTVDSKHCGTAGGKLSAGTLQDLQKQFTISANTPVCVYTPKVQLLDNWGWCNATKVGGAQNNCYYGFSDGIAGCYGRDTKIDSGNGCDIKYQGGTDPYPWTDFSGSIIVLPNQ